MSRVPVKAPKPPRGWRLLRKGATVQEGDKFWCVHYWSETDDPGKVLSLKQSKYPYIRRITGKRKGAK